MASLVSGFQSGIFSSGGSNSGGKRQSLTNINLPAKLEESQLGGRMSVARHSARMPSAQEKQNIVDPRGKWVVHNLRHNLR
jgi:hypothetical protein